MHHYVNAQGVDERMINVHYYYYYYYYGNGYQNETQAQKVSPA